MPALETALGRPVGFIETLEGAETLTDEARAADVLLLENIRFHPGEEANDPDLPAVWPGWAMYMSTTPFPPPTAPMPAPKVWRGSCPPAPGA